MEKSESAKPILVVKDLRVWYPIRRLLSVIGYVRAVDNVSFSAPRGKILAIVGESGCGKTTLARAVLGLVPVYSGSIVFEGRDIVKLPKTIIRKWYTSQVGLVQQDPYGAMPPFMSIKTILEEPMKIHGVPRQERTKRVYEALTEVGLTPPEDFIFKYPHMLSGGQLQRVAIARALILRPKLVLADEPVSMLDASVRIEILTLFKELKEKYNLTVLYITHDFATAKHFSDDIMVMYAGQIVEIGGSKEVIAKPKHPYTEALLSILPDPDPNNRFTMKKTLPGEPPSLIRPPPGCRLWPRCPYVMDKCKREEPPLIEITEERRVKCWLYA
ncbi:MAG: ABC transporter ATP-binding protein [Desulfurococcaceae archaeon]|nr:ABC transporter ATP-binding protein [Desulfurococcaceae archaeon]